MLWRTPVSSSFVFLPSSLLWYRVLDGRSDVGLLGHHNDRRLATSGMLCTAILCWHSQGMDTEELEMLLSAAQVRP